MTIHLETCRYLLFPRDSRVIWAWFPRGLDTISVVCIVYQNPMAVSLITLIAIYEGVLA